MLQNIPHQVVQSPARLGLPTPNSPSLSNPPKFPSQQPSQSNQVTVAPVSDALLPLLPPLPRAQTLLLQMASLSSKLFEVSSKRSHWTSSFRGTLPTFLSSQTQSLPPPALDSTKEILAKFTVLQKQLFEAVAELQEILDLQDAKEKISREIRTKDSALLAFSRKLFEAENVLDDLMDDYSDYRQPKRSKSVQKEDEDDSTTSVGARLKLSDILTYAHRISYTTFAPPEFGAGQVPLRGALPPAPQEEQMRASQLYNFADLDVGLPKMDDGKDKIVEPLLEIPPSMPDPRGLPGMPGLLPPDIVVPSGWKPGMPVELPRDLPILPPPGWKPGDPISLPPLDSLPLPPRIEPRPVPCRVGVAPEPIHVRHVELDLDKFESSSDYSSDTGSSENED